jgi:hypothetical protein
MKANRIVALLEHAQRELDELLQDRAELVNSIDRQIEQVRRAVEALKLAGDVRGGQAVSTGNGEKSAPIANDTHPATLKTPARLITDYLEANPGASTLEVLGALERFVKPSASKTPRRILSGAIWDLKKREKVRADDKGFLFIST